jgi:hypothetical protein
MAVALRTKLAAAKISIDSIDSIGCCRDPTFAFIRSSDVSQFEAGFFAIPRWIGHAKSGFSPYKQRSRTRFTRRRSRQKNFLHFGPESGGERGAESIPWSALPN